MNVTDEHFARIFRETFSGRNKARCLPKGCTPITRMNKLRKHFTQAVFTNTLREKSPSDGKKRFFRQHIAMYHIESRAFHVKQRKKQEKPTLLDARSKETALHYLNSSSSERPKHYLSAHPITRWRCALTALCRYVLITLCRMFRTLLLTYSDRSLLARSEQSLLTYPARSSLVRSDYSSWICATLSLFCRSKRIGNNAHTKRPALRYFDNKPQMFHMKHLRLITA